MNINADNQRKWFINGEERRLITFLQVVGKSTAFGIQGVNGIFE